MSIKKLVLSGCCFILFVGVHAQRNMKVVAAYPLSGNGHFDYLSSSKDNKLYVSHGNEVNVMDEATGKETAVIRGLSGVHGIAFDNENNKGFISNGAGNYVAVFDLKTNKILDSIATDKNPDGIIYEPFTKTIITGNGKGKTLSVIDPATDKVVHTIPLPGKPETAASDGNGLLFVNIEDKSEIVEINLKNFSIVKEIPLSPKGESPSGLAIDTKNKLLFAGCDNKTLVVVDYAKGIVANAYPIGDGCDAVAYNPKTQTVFSSNGEGTLTVLNRKGKADDFDVYSVPTKKSARTMALNINTNTVYLSSVDYSNTTDANGRKAVAPDSFKIIVVK